MKVIIAAVGKSKAKDPAEVMIQEYLVRFPWKIEIKEIDHKSSMAEESEGLVALTSSHYLIALDAKGDQFSSEAFANLLNNLQTHGKSKVAFAIGGASGHDSVLLDKADKVISLGKMTLPHKLAKLVLVEQIYRAYTILNNHPYNK